MARDYGLAAPPSLRPRKVRWECRGCGHRNVTERGADGQLRGACAKCGAALKRFTIEGP